MLRVFQIILFLFIFSFASSNYLVPVQKEKSLQIQKAIKLYQYLYDLKKLDEILQLLYKNKKFKNLSETAELSIKNINSRYSYEYIEALIKILNGKNGKSGYIRYIEDKLYRYRAYLINYPKDEVISKNFDFYEKNIQNELDKLNYNRNIRPVLRVIFENLIFVLEEVAQETIELKKLGIINPFTNKDDEKYLIPKNWAQPDGKTTLANIINFILNGDKKYGFYGINFYYSNIYNISEPLIIRR